MKHSMLADQETTLKSIPDKYKYPVILRNRHWKVLTTGAVKGQEIYCHLLEVVNKSNGSDIVFRPKQICEYLPLHEVFSSPDLSLIEKIIEFRVPACNSAELATEISINWLILKEAGYTKQEINQAINTGIELSILCRGLGGSLHVN